MKQVIQNVKTGQLSIPDVPPPSLIGPGVLVLNRRSIVSAGTEKLVMDFSKKNLLQKAKARPDLVKKVLTMVKREGWKAALETAFARLDQPMPLGYSCCGDVIAVDKSVTHVKPGDRVACAGASYAVHSDIIYVPKNLVVKVPENVSYEEAAFGTLGAISMQGVRVAKLQLGDKVAVIGLGLLGLIVVQLVKAAGCTVIGCDLDDKKLELAKKFGADEVCKPAELEGVVMAICGGMGVDATIISASTPSNQPIESAGEITRMKGRVSIIGAVGTNIPRKPYYDKEIEICISRSYGPGRYDSQYEEKGLDYPYGYVRWTEQRNIECFLDLIAAGKIDVKELITHRYSIDEAEDAYKLISGEVKEPYIGIVLSYPEEAPEEKAVHIKSAGKIKPSVGKTVGIAVVGSGTFATNVMLPALKKMANVKLVGVVDQNGMAAKHAAEKYGFEYAAGAIDEVLQDDKVEAVFIATRHDSHAENAIKALQAGKHVAVEKPLCLKSEELTEIVDAYNQAGKKFLLGFNRRFAPVAVKAKECFGDEIKCINYTVNAGFIPTDIWVHDPDIGGGRIIGEVCHFIDWIQWFTGGYVKEVNAVCVDGGNPAIPDRDNVFVTLQLSDGSIGTVLYASNGDKSFRKEHIEIFGGSRVAVIDECRLGSITASGKRTNLGKSSSKGHFEQWQAFINSILEGKDSPVPFVDCIISTMATFAVVESLDTASSITIPEVVNQ